MKQFTRLSLFLLLNFKSRAVDWATLKYSSLLYKYICISPYIKAQLKIREVAKIS